MRYYISDLKDYVGQKIELKGWAYNTRSSGKVKFLDTFYGAREYLSQIRGYYPSLLDAPIFQNAFNKLGIRYIAFQYSENINQFKVIKEQVGAFSDSIKLWEDEPAAISNINLTATDSCKH